MTAKNVVWSQAWWLKSVILATWKEEIGIVVGGQPKKKDHETPSQPIAGCGCACLSSHLHGEAQI
jgi:hypothetical protein